MARLSYREASGWLAQAHIWIHPHDLALRDSGLTSSYGAAFRAGRLRAELPWTTRNGDFEQAPSDIVIGQALRLARLWRRLAELRTWRPLADENALQETLESLGCRPDRAVIAEWLALIEGLDGPLLVRIGRAAQEWRNFPGIDQRGPEGPFLAACLWHGRQARSLPLPFWTAPDPRHSRLELQTGLPWMAQFLDCVTAAATVGCDELDRLQRAEAKAVALVRTKRSRLPDAMDAALRMPTLTAGNLAKTLAVSPQAALALLRQLAEAGIIQEATGRASWRAFTICT